MDDYKPTPSEADMRRLRSSEKKFAKQSLKKTLSELGGLLARINQQTSELFDSLGQLATRIERTEKDIFRLLGGNDD